MAHFLQQTLATIGNNQNISNATFAPVVEHIGQHSVLMKQHLAEGAYGIVDLVVDQHSQRELVLKRCSVERKENFELVNKEINILRKFTGPYIVEYLGSEIVRGNNGKEALILLSYCPGGNLFERLSKRQGHFVPYNTCLTIFHQILQSVKVFHDHAPPVSHRDLKLENILFAADGTIRLCDFGSCCVGYTYLRTASERAEAEEIIAHETTPMYRAPEMIDLYLREVITEKSDIWALGCIFATICYLRHPFQDVGSLGILSCKLHFPEAAEAPVEARELVSRALDLDPEARPTIDELIFYVCEQLAGKPLPPHHITEEAKQKREERIQANLVREQKRLAKAKASNNNGVVPERKSAHVGVASDSVAAKRLAAKRGGMNAVQTFDNNAATATTTTKNTAKTNKQQQEIHFDVNFDDLQPVVPSPQQQQQRDSFDGFHSSFSASDLSFGKPLPDWNNNNNNNNVQTADFLFDDDGGFGAPAPAPAPSKAPTSATTQTRATTATSQQSFASFDNDNNNNSYTDPFESSSASFTSSATTTSKKTTTPKSATDSFQASGTTNNNNNGNFDAFESKKTTSDKGKATTSATTTTTAATKSSFDAFETSSGKLTTATPAFTSSPTTSQKNKPNIQTQQQQQQQQQVGFDSSFLDAFASTTSPKATNNNNNNNSGSGKAPLKVPSNNNLSTTNSAVSTPNNNNKLTSNSSFDPFDAPPPPSHYTGKSKQQQQQQNESVDLLEFLEHDAPTAKAKTTTATGPIDLLTSDVATTTASKKSITIEDLLDPFAATSLRPSQQQQQKQQQSNKTESVMKAFERSNSFGPQSSTIQQFQQYQQQQQSPQQQQQQLQQPALYRASSHGSGLTNTMSSMNSNNNSIINNNNTAAQGVNQQNRFRGLNATTNRDPFEKLNVIPGKKN